MQYLLPCGLNKYCILDLQVKWFKSLSDTVCRGQRVRGGGGFKLHVGTVYFKDIFKQAPHHVVLMLAQTLT